MRILAISSWCPYPPDNGSKLRIYKLLMHLAKQHSIRLLSFAEQGEDPQASPLAELCESVQTVPGNPFKPQAPLAALDLFGTTPRSYRQTYSTDMQVLVDQALPQCDAAIAFEIGAALYLAGHRGIPTILEEVETTVIRDRFHRRTLSPAKMRAGLTWWKYSRFVQQLVESFDRSTVVSEIERQHLVEIGCDAARVRVVANGVDRAALFEPNKPVPGHMIYSGSVTYSPNLEAVQYFVRDILPRIQAARPDALLKVTGETGTIDTSELSNLGVIFTGRVPDIQSEVTSSAVCVVPLKSGGGTRLKILEALALGTPVVATTKGAEGLAVTNGENILIADTPAAFAAHVIRVLDDASLRRRLAANGRELIGRLYTWKQIGLALDGVLKEAVESRGTNPITMAGVRQSYASSAR
jgi:glycosyltransferase involved in cell wall biosynthesis